MPDFKQKFYDISGLIQTEFDRNLDMYGDKIQCRKGCSGCCSQIFRITPLDGWIIGRHIRSLPESRQLELKQKALEYLSKVPLEQGDLGGFENQSYPGSSSHPSLEKEGSLLSNLPCPALGLEGECTIYEARPVICRRFGMPIYDYKNPESVHACELNFKDGEEIADDKLIPNQTEIGMKWDELKDEFNTNMPTYNLLEQTGEETERTDWTTIAEAILKA